MATIVGDFATDSSRFHGMIPQHQHAHEAPYRSPSRTREAPSRRSSSASRYQRRSTNASGWQVPVNVGSEQQPQQQQLQQQQGVSRLPSPPSSSSSASQSTESIRAQDEQQRQSMEPEASQAVRVAAPASTTSTAATLASQPPIPAYLPAPIPSPTSNRSSPLSSGVRQGTEYGSLDNTGRPGAQPQGHTIHVRDLAHVQSLARADLLTGNGPGILNDPPLQAMKYEISAMPIGDIIEMVAALLTKITTANDMQYDANHRNATHQQHAAAAAAAAAGGGHGDSSMSPLSTSVLAFHGKNVPAITILSYLSRIHKYCPTTYEVFLSLLVYFDRMTERVNTIVRASEVERAKQRAETMPDADTKMTDDAAEHSDELDEDLADDDDEGEAPKSSSAAAETTATPHVATYFVVDSYNIHRLIIAGVTCASKFFSDVFYTNSRYAKVGGLPLAELNHLELEFLQLNDFRLAVAVEDLEAYATMLVEFYAREVVAQRATSTPTSASPGSRGSSSTTTAAPPSSTAE